jgi:hypothetical protein
MITFKQWLWEGFVDMLKSKELKLFSPFIVTVLLDIMFLAFFPEGYHWLVFIPISIGLGYLVLYALYDCYKMDMRFEEVRERWRKRL